MPSWTLQKAIEHGLQQSDDPPIYWDPEASSFVITIRGVNFSEGELTKATRLSLSPPELYIVNVRKKGQKAWGVGFITPLRGVGFSNLESGRYQVRIRTVDRDGNPVPDTPDWEGEFDAR